MTITINAKAAVPEVLIYGEIVSDSATKFDAELKALGQVANLSIRINSPGGNVFAGSAIFQMLKRHPARKTAYVDGIAASMASLIAMAGDRIIMAENAVMMIHDPTGVAEGGTADMRRMVDLLEGIRQQLVGTYSRRTGLSEARVAEMMAAETIMTAAEAVKAGFADAVEGRVQAAAMRQMAEFDLSGFKRSPLPKTIEDYTSQFWAARGKSASVDAAARTAVEDRSQDDDTSDLVVKEWDVDAIWARFNGKGGVK